ncbi:hypothetical protein Hanom_Chr07g00679741 [Helianthus anomalus]
MFAQYPTPNNEVNKPVPTIPIVKKIRKFIRSPICPEKNMPTAYTIKKAKSISPSNTVPFDPLNGAQPFPKTHESHESALDLRKNEGDCSLSSGV